nr:immunoglobulin heavy chain junction region [Macaca mulatta]MPN71258.1 immunoglobulin heavy chain junction region [Macaca mulatta]MPN72785.1 immunoglobulin heavy chain junction region [Macaca mulatta]MPN73466.1 immunoglobulin heavy chain junction region [Macaca mulatta]MPN74148.1 immunoglobulin heavy chain junction region [Macaca mulatta]
CAREGGSSGWYHRFEYW